MAYDQPVGRPIGAWQAAEGIRLSSAARQVRLETQSLTPTQVEGE